MNLFWTILGALVCAQFVLPLLLLALKSRTFWICLGGIFAFVFLVVAFALIQSGVSLHNQAVQEAAEQAHKAEQVALESKRYNEALAQRKAIEAASDAASRKTTEEAARWLKEHNLPTYNPGTHAWE